MVGEAARLTRTIIGIAAASLASAIVAAPKPAWIVDASCRDGEPQGPYQLRTGDRQLRVAGAFNAGKRTGSFIFWTAKGVRAAHIPYDDDVRNGTVAVWYDGPSGREPARRFESVWHRGSRDGQTRSWHADGHRRSETEYAGGRYVSSIGWTDAGDRLADAAARDLAAHDARTADAIYAELDALILDHLPRCE
jgi:hypothetical protein